MFQLALNPAASHRLSEVVPWLTTWELIDVSRSINDNTSEAVVLCTQGLSKWLELNPEPDHDGPRLDDEVLPFDVVWILAEFSSNPDEVSRLCRHENSFVRRIASRNPLATPEGQVIVALLSGT